MIKKYFFLNFIFVLAIVTQAQAELICVLGQPDFTAADKSVDEIVAAAALLKAPAKGTGSTAEAARQQRLELAYIAIESALKSEAVNELPKARAYWRLATQDLGDTQWRMSQAVKSGDVRARWLALELSEHEKPTPWQDAACDELGPASAALAARSTSTSAAKSSPAASSPESSSPESSSAESSSALYRRALCAAKTNPKLALEFMKNAALDSHPAALEAYGRLCAEQGDKGRECAVEMLCRAADAGRKSAAGLAAYLLTSETPTPALAVKAAALYEMAFAAGDAASANNLGEVYERGWIGRPNITQAIIWYRLASEKGVIQANLNLGRLLWRSDSTKQEARSLIERARTTMPTEASKLLHQLEGSRD